MPGGKPSLLDALVEFVREEGAQLIESVKPLCGICGETSYAPIPCMHCGRCSCHEHGFFNVGMLRSICADCAGVQHDGVIVEQEEELPEPTWPWDSLHIQPTRDLSAINKAYRRQAGKLHADACAGTEQDKMLWAGLNAAYEEAKRLAKGGQDA